MRGRSEGHARRQNGVSLREAEPEPRQSSATARFARVPRRGDLRPLLAQYLLSAQAGRANPSSTMSEQGESHFKEFRPQGPHLTPPPRWPIAAVTIHSFLMNTTENSKQIRCFWYNRRHYHRNRRRF